MRNDMQPGTGVRTIGGMYATVKEVNEDTVLLEVAPGVHAHSTRRTPSAPSSSDDEYNRIVHGIEHDLKTDDAVVPDDASSLTETDELRRRRCRRVRRQAHRPRQEGRGRRAGRRRPRPTEPKADDEPKKTDGESDAK